MPPIVNDVLAETTTIGLYRKLASLEHRLPVCLSPPVVETTAIQPKPACAAYATQLQTRVGRVLPM